MIDRLNFVKVSLIKWQFSKYLHKSKYVLFLTVSFYLINLQVVQNHNLSLSHFIYIYIYHIPYSLPITKFGPLIKFGIVYEFLNLILLEKPKCFYSNFRGSLFCNLLVLYCIGLIFSDRRSLICDVLSVLGQMRARI